MEGDRKTVFGMVWMHDRKTYADGMDAWQKDLCGWYGCMTERLMRMVWMHDRKTMWMIWMHVRLWMVWMHVRLWMVWMHDRKTVCGWYGCRLLDCLSYIYICRFYSFVIHVFHPCFPLNGIKQYMTKKNTTLVRSRTVSDNVACVSHCIFLCFWQAYSSFLLCSVRVLIENNRKQTRV